MIWNHFPGLKYSLALEESRVVRVRVAEFAECFLCAHLHAIHSIPLGHQTSRFPRMQRKLSLPLVHDATQLVATLRGRQKTPRLLPQVLTLWWAPDSAVFGAAGRSFVPNSHGTGTIATGMPWAVSIAHSPVQHGCHQQDIGSQRSLLRELRTLQSAPPSSLTRSTPPTMSGRSVEDLVAQVSAVL